MKNILVISWHFAPRNTIGAIRFTKMVKYLARTGEYHFWVICSSLNEEDIRDELLQRDMDGVSRYVTILPVPLNRIRLIETFKNHTGKRLVSPQESNDANRATLSAVNSIVSAKEKSITGKVKSFFGKSLIALNDLYIFVCDDLSFARKGIKLSKKLPMDKMDTMLTTWGPTGSLLLGLKYKKLNKSLKWIVDYRDPCTTSGRFLKWYLSYVAYKADKNAAYITGAGRTHIGSGKYMEKFHMIRNGFDKEDISGLSNCEHHNKLWITYTGTIYDGKDNMKPLFKILHELELEKQISKEHISVIYAGTDYHIMQKQAKECGMESILVNKGKLSRKKALELQYQSDILCVLAWNTKKERDVMISMNELGVLLLQTSGVKMLPYYNYLLELSQTVPILTGYGNYIDKDGITGSYTNEYTYNAEIQKYFWLEYDNLRKTSSDKWFTLQTAVKTE